MKQHRRVSHRQWLPDGAIDRYDLQAALRRAGLNIEDIGRRAGCTGRMVAYVITGERNSATVERALAAALGVPQQRIHALIHADPAADAAA